MKCKVRGPRSRWVGPSMSAPKSELGRSPIGRQKHYGAVELAGAGDQVNVNDVVEVAESKQEVQGTRQRHPVLVQVLSLWEDTFTGVFKFRARWLVQASDLPADALSRLRVTRQPAAADGNTTGSTTPLGQDQDGADEVFLTKRVQDLEVRSMVKPITLCVSTSGTAEVSPERKQKMGPRLTYSFCDASGKFRPLEGTDPILKRARVRQANAVALASRADQEHEAAKSGKPVVKSNGWLLPKRGAFERRGGRIAARGAGGGVEIVAPSNSTGSDLSSTSPSVDIEEPSDDSAPDEPPPSEDDEWKEGEDENATDSDSDSPRNSQPIFSVDEGFTQRKSARQRKSQLSPTPDANPDADPDTDPDAKVVEECPVETCVDKPCPAPSIAGPTFQRRRRAPSNKRQGPLPPRPRRLAMPPMVEEPPIAHVCDALPHACAKPSVAVKVVPPVRTRMSLGLRPKSSLALPRSASMEDVSKASPQVSVSAKRKRSVANKATHGGNRSDYPPLRTLVGKDYQTDIPDLLSADERNQPHTGAGAEMVWRSVQDWDPQSRGMLASYLHAAKGVVETKQARPGVAVHVRLGGKNDSIGVDKDENTGIASSYAVWAISSGREAGGLVRVACSEMAQTDIPRSAIQGVQSQEQALSALVKARCVLDDFEPALEMLAGDQGSPESIETWTLKQVRTLENALVKEYDPNRRLHGWARPGMEMDREDFIDLAKVTQQVPGKTSSQVLSFYYRYLAAAEPLTDVYGPEAAKARKEEPICPVSCAHEADVTLPSNGGPTRGNANTTNPKMPARQVSPGLAKGSAAISTGQSVESAPKPKLRVIRLSAPKHAEPFVGNHDPNYGLTIDNVPKDDASIRRVPSPPAFDAVCSAPEDAVNSRPRAVSEYATNEATPGGKRPAIPDRLTGRELAEADRVTGILMGRQGGRGGGLDSASEHLAQQRRCVVRERKVTRALPPLPSDAEVLEVEDSDDADGGDVCRNSAVSSPGRGEPVQPPNVEAAARRITSMRPAGLSLVARKNHKHAAPAVAPESQPGAVLPMAPRAVSLGSDIIERKSADSCDAARYGYRSDVPDFLSAKTESSWEHPPRSQTTRHEEYVRRFDDPPSGGGFESGDIPSGVYSGPGYTFRRNIHVGSEPPSRDEMFGSMAPCWRLLERAKGYMDKDQLKYMKGLILTHVRKPMSRDQLLERAESCLQEQDKIFSAFVKMFDHIDQPPQVPLYPTKRALHPRSQWTPYSTGRSLEVDPDHASPHGLPSPNMPPSRSFDSQEGGSYLLRSTNDGGDPTSKPSQPYPRVGIPVGSHGERRRSIHPYDHNGAGGWRASEVRSTARDDAVGTRAQLPPRRPSPGPHQSELSVHPSGYPESRYGTGNIGGVRVRNPWPQNPPGEWNTDRFSSAAAAVAAAAAAAPAAQGGMTWRGSRGPAWGGNGGGTWN